MHLRIYCSLMILLIVSLPARSSSSDDAPAWLQSAAALSVPTYEKDVPAVALQNERAVSVSDDGRVTTTTTYAVRILTREGRYFAHAQEPYLTKTGKVRELHAWLIRPNGIVKKYGKDETVDRISDPNDIYNEYRIKLIDGSDDADAGAVFGYQSISEEQPLFSQEIWRFQNRLPSLLSRYSLALPNAWRATSLTFNHAKVEPTVSGSTYSWELRNLAPVRPEPASPEVSNLAPWLAISYFLADSGSSANAKTFENWVQVSRWGTEMHDPQSIPDDSVASKARELTADAKTEIERIKAIGRFVQNLQYISIDIGVGRGNGYRPHPASQVFAKGYGDCKDKANLMRAMLKAINITAYPVFIYLGDPTHVREDWASPTQFNHCIVAVKVGNETNSDTILENPALGRLLIFDATDQNTPVGDLPEEEQGSFALVVAGQAGQLMKMPSLPPESSSVERQAEVVLAADGSITSTIRERANGQSAADFRREFRRFSRPEYLKMIEAWVTNGATAAKVMKVEPRDNSADGRFDLDVEFSASFYAQLMQNRLLVFKPAIVSRREALFLTDAIRTYPIVLDSHAFTETVHVKLPVGFEVDELPDPLKLDTPFGSYKTTYEVKNGELFFTRALAQRGMTIPPDQYQTVRGFYERIRAAEQAPVVLARK